MVEKPGSMPVRSKFPSSLTRLTPSHLKVHATGRYNFNTLLSILKYDYDLPLVHSRSRRPIRFRFRKLTTSVFAASNRLDRLTSGVMVCALTVEASKKLGAWFGGQRAAEGGVDKEYVARCVGRFPECVDSLPLSMSRLTHLPLLTAEKSFATSRCLRLIGKSESTSFTLKVE